MDNIDDALRESHGVERKLCWQLVRTKADDPHALEIHGELRVELAAHAVA